MSNTSTNWLTSITRSEAELTCAFLDGYGIERILTLPALGKPTCSCLLVNSECVHIQWAKQLSPDMVMVQEAQTQKSEEQKQQRQADRVAKLEQAMQELQIWIEDQLSRGLATQIHESQDFAQGISIRMADASLGSLTRQLRKLEQETVRDLRQNKPLPNVWTHLLLLLQAGSNQTQLPDALWSALTQALGINMRKDEVKAIGKHFKDQFTVVAVDSVRVDTNLVQRNTWLFAKKLNSYYVFIEYEVERVSWLAAPLQPGFHFEAEAWIYPGAGQLRLLLEQIPEKGSQAPMLQCALPDLAHALEQFTQRLKELPWLTEWPIALEGVIVRPTKASWQIIDSGTDSFPLLNNADSKLLPEQLMSLSAANTITVFGLLSQDGLRVLRTH